MRKWGIVISLLYALIVVGLLVPVSVLLAGSYGPFEPSFRENLMETYQEWGVWVPVGMVLIGQAVLLFLSVDTSWKRLKPRTHLAVTCVIASMLAALLGLAVVECCGVTVNESKFLDLLDTWGKVFALWGGLWVLWGVVFWLYLRGSSQAATRAVAWLLRGSVLELLIAVPCHVIVRRRNECCAPVLTSFGIVTGIAVMLLSFGPSVLLLYKKRLDGYRGQSKAGASS